MGFRFHEPTIIEPLYSWNEARALAVSGDYIYWIGPDSGSGQINLYRANLKSQPFTRQLVDGNWIAIYAMGVADGYVYWVSGDVVNRAQITTEGRLAPTEEVDRSGYTGTKMIAMSDGFMYWVAKGGATLENLYRARPSANLSSRETVDTNWSAVEAMGVTGGNVYWATEGNLYRESLNSTPFSRQLVDEGRWTVTRAIAVANGSIYWVGRRSAQPNDTYVLFKMSLNTP